MDSNKHNAPKQNRSMFLYTALIFVVALLLIILAFFGQTNLSHLRRTADERSAALQTESAATPAPIPSEPADPDAMAKLANTVSSLDAENKKLEKQLEIYDNLAQASLYISAGNKTEAAAIIGAVDTGSLTENQKTLYEQIKAELEK